MSPCIFFHFQTDMEFLRTDLMYRKTANLGKLMSGHRLICAVKTHYFLGVDNQSLLWFASWSKVSECRFIRI